jgi:hypothetical protein
VHDPCIVSHRESLARLPKEARHFREGQPVEPAEARREVFPPEQLHDDVESVVLHPIIHDLYDVGAS